MTPLCFNKQTFFFFFAKEANVDFVCHIGPKLLSPLQIKE